MTLSTRNEEKVRRAFAALSNMTPTGSDFEDVTSGSPLEPPSPRPRQMAIVAVVSAIGALALVVFVRRRNESGARR